MNQRLPLTIMLLALLAGCAGPAPLPDDLPIADLTALPQDAAAYFEPAQADQLVLAPDKQAKLADAYRSAYYAPWRMTKPAHDAAAALERLEDYRPMPVYGGNRRLLAPAWFESIRIEMNLDAFGPAGGGFPAITLRNTNLRKLPTPEPIFVGTDLAEDYYPFDELQVSAIWGNTPVCVTHLSRDGAYTLVEAPYEWGWVATSDLARVDQAFMNRWQGRPLGSIVQDKTAFRTQEGRFLFRTHIGAVVPMEAKAGADPAAAAVLAATASDAGAGPLPSARIVTVRLPTAAVAVMPLPATRRNLALLANRFLGQPYAWGGLNEDRDCSATLRDLFTPLGVFLPRDSADQYQAGRVIDVSDLAPAQKQRKLLSEGAAWRTLVYARGHIMLYVGSRQGRAVIFHTFWAVRTRPRGPCDARRHVVGQTVLTTLQPGRERPDFDPAGDLLTRIDAFTILGE